MALNKKTEARRKERRLIQTNVRLSRPHRNWLKGRARRMSSESGVDARLPDVIRKMIDDEIARERGAEMMDALAAEYGEKNAEEVPK